MTTNVRLFVIAVACVLCALLALTTFAQIQKAPAHVKWEYCDGANLQIDQINKLGDEGWELAQVVTFGRDYYYIFKRPK
jgi:hypothetical protein